MTPWYMSDDTDKVRIYEGAAIREYIIIDIHAGDKSIPFEIIGWRLARGRYRKIIPDLRGRLSSNTTGTWFALDAGGREVIITNKNTGEKYLSNLEEHKAHIEERGRFEAETRAEQAANSCFEAQLRAEQAELRAEREARLRLEDEAEIRR